MPIDFELAADAVRPVGLRETAVAMVGLGLWTVGYCAILALGGTIALGVWGAQSAYRAVRK